MTVFHLIKMWKESTFGCLTVRAPCLPNSAELLWYFSQCHLSLHKICCTLWRCGMCVYQIFYRCNSMSNHRDQFLKILENLENWSNSISSPRKSSTPVAESVFRNGRKKKPLKSAFPWLAIQGPRHCLPPQVHQSLLFHHPSKFPLFFFFCHAPNIVQLFERIVHCLLPHRKHTQHFFCKSELIAFNLAVTWKENHNLHIKAWQGGHTSKAITQATLSFFSACIHMAISSCHLTTCTTWYGRGTPWWCLQHHDALI